VERSVVEPASNGAIDWLDRSEYPFASHFLELPPGRLHYVDEGAGEPIIMVHGQPTWSYIYRNVIRGLAPRFRCIAIDLLGFGLSDKPESWSYRPEQHAEHIGALLDHLGVDRTHLLVHDWGGPIGLGWAANHPDRIDRIVALDTWMWSMREQLAGRIFSQLLGNPIGRLATRRFNLFVTQFMRRALPGRWDDVAAAYTGPLARPEDRMGCALFPQMLCAPWLDEIWQRRDALRHTEAMLVWGGDDPAFPAASRERLASVFEHCRVEVQPGVGHFVAEEMGAALPNLIEDFLRSNGSG
jgi:haloalkane dehalogenase